MRTLVFLLVLAAVPVQAQAQGGGGSSPQAVPLRRAGVEGVWLPLPEARLALEARLEVPRLTARVQLLQESLALATEELELVRRAAALGTDREAALEAALAAATQAGQAAEAARRVVEADRDAWWRHPGLWAAVGAVLGGLVVGLVAAAVP
jgi:ElaB/YqjD/DUF883 family membrane-anchored ribosome-binding protein